MVGVMLVNAEVEGWGSCVCVICGELKERGGNGDWGFENENRGEGVVAGFVSKQGRYRDTVIKTKAGEKIE